MPKSGKRKPTKGRAKECTSGKGKDRAQGVCPPKTVVPKLKQRDFRKTPMSDFKAKPKNLRRPAGRKR